MTFAFIEPHPSEDDPLQAELALLDLAAQGSQAAQLWEAPVSLVVPRSYLRYERFEAARDRFARRGCPVWLRMSGGGLVPQGPGILNLSLAYSVDGPPGALSEAVYLHLCEVVGRALRTLGVETHWQAVNGSFCDGRFNLAWGPPGQARKIAGTAQYWRRAPAAAQAPDGQRHLVLAHAVLLVSADPVSITQRANDFEAEAGTGRHYDADKVVSVQQAMGAADEDGAGLMEQVLGALRASVAVTPPHA
ncbi:lipoate--protein ligase family protein [Cupriavidus sp. WKF15]|uniref:lipoyl protein ligase domain-containing protein n=1 Tax=Cupriavidus sp. WKF15 TaxID=3032282 RepID=UPI0023E27CA8|nr:lipoate--protein ligase family protein [Cupriavidus sp. WKF15]WER49713.1 lipoate--protein ligase family protein [Cupriavidus sp. WKF15]